MSYDKDHDLDHDYAGQEAFERWERQHPDMHDEDDNNDPAGWTDDEDYDSPEEKHLKQVADAVDDILGGGRR